MDGMACLGHLVEKRKQRVVILSTLALDNSFTTFKALALGAVDFVTKPGTGRYLSSLEELGRELAAKVRIAAVTSRERVAPRHATGNSPTKPRESGPPPSIHRAADSLPRLIVGIGGSTGGAMAVGELLTTLPAGIPAAVVVVQHLPHGFSGPFARYLDASSLLRVKEAEEGEALARSTVYVAPAEAHVRLQRRDGAILFRLDSSTPPDLGFRPSVNVLLYSLAAAERHRAMAILLSGMGEDGVRGLSAVRQFGGRTLVQDRASSVVYDMAERAVRLDVVDDEMPPRLLANAIVDASGFCAEPALAATGWA
jgi:two-component system chemotaxis response regulator CheB